MRLDLVSRSVEETASLGARLGTKLKGGEVIAVSGPLGAGKTSFVKGVGQGLNLQPEEMISPTFILRAEYYGKLPLAHIDLYRLNDEDEIGKLGLFEQEDPRTVLIIEWPERAESLLPAERMDISIAPLEGTCRRLSFGTAGRGLDYLLEGLKTDDAKKN